MKSGKLAAQEIWGIPAILAVVSAVGLISALVGDGVWDWLSWIALAIPLIVTSRYLLRAS